jgi:hypothetical protein
VRAAVAKAGGTTADKQAPTAAITSPAASSSVSGLVTVTVNAADNVGVDRVELKVNGGVVAIDNASPFSFSWNSAGAANGMNTLVATAYDKAGNATSSSPVSINVANGTTTTGRDTTPPVVTIDSPVAGAVSGSPVWVTSHVTDNNGAAGVTSTQWVDGQLFATNKGGSFAFSWYTGAWAAGNHTVKVVSTDAAGNSATATVVVNLVK